jgi:UrcA family protein
MKAQSPMTRSMIVLASLSAATMLWTSAATASPLGEHGITRTETVKYLPSALESVDGATQLYEDLKAAAERVCRDPENFASGSMQRDNDAKLQCMTDALRKAVRRIDMPMVTFLHQDRGQAQTVARR